MQTDVIMRDSLCVIVDAYVAHVNAAHSPVSSNVGHDLIRGVRPGHAFTASFYHMGPLHADLSTHTRRQAVHMLDGRPIACTACKPPMHAVGPGPASMSYSCLASPACALDGCTWRMALRWRAAWAWCTCMMADGLPAGAKPDTNWRM